MADLETERGWKTIMVKPIRITGKWITGLLVQENPSGDRRVKIFKGVIKQNGPNQVEHNGKVYRFSMIQRFNVPSLDYWLKISEEVAKTLREYVEGGKGQSLLTEFGKKKK